MSKPIYKNPIKEIVFRISFAKDLDLERIKEFCEAPEIRKDFPSYNRGFDVKFTPGEKPSGEFKHSGYILKSEKMILNIKIGRIALHLIDQYEPFPVILESLDRYWNVLQTVFGGIPVTQVSTRYINQIKIPDGEQYNDYIDLVLNSHFNAVKKPFIKFEVTPNPKIKNVKTDVIIAINEQKKLILDINVRKTTQVEELKNISDVFLDLRPIKNNVFQSLITDKTKQMFAL